MREDLARYVKSGEPPMGLSAEAIIGTGRRHRRWRRGFGVGGAAVAASAAIGALIMLAPANGSSPPAPWANPTASAAPCTLPIPTGTVVPSPSITPVVSDGAQKPQQTREAGPFTDGTAHDLTCFLSLKVPAELPGAVFIPLNAYEAPPFSVNIVRSGENLTYQAGATIRLGDAVGTLYLSVSPEWARERPPGKPATGFASTAQSSQDGSVIVEAWTGSSYIFLSASAGSPVSKDFLESFATSPELDVFR